MIIVNIYDAMFGGIKPWHFEYGQHQQGSRDMTDMIPELFFQKHNEEPHIIL
jgi:hypothetical protein